MVVANVAKSHVGKGGSLTSTHCDNSPPGREKIGTREEKGEERKGWYCRPAQGAKESREMKGKRRDRKQRRGESRCGRKVSLVLLSTSGSAR